MAFLFYDSTQKVACPRCGQLPTKPCRSPSGKRLSIPHIARIHEWCEHPDFNDDDYSITMEKQGA